MAAYQYGSIPDQEGQYTQQFEPPPGYQPPPGYPSGGQPQQYAQTDVVNEAHPLHQPVNNSFDTRQQQGFYNQPLSNPQGYSQLPPYQNQGQVGFNPNGYAPAPATYQQQQQQQQHVIQSQPQTARQQQPHGRQAAVQISPQATTFLIPTIVLAALCFMHGNCPAFFCLVPALLGAYMAEEHNKADRLTQAKKCGYFALCCNITAIIYFVVFLVVCFGVIIASVVIDPSSLGPSSLASS